MPSWLPYLGICIILLEVARVVYRWEKQIRKDQKHGNNAKPEAESQKGNRKWI